jgi:hypothetical protein
MTLVKMNQILEHAKVNNYGAGEFFRCPDRPITISIFATLYNLSMFHIHKARET